MKSIIMALTIVGSVGQAKIPTWASSDSTKLTGSILRTICHGVGPSVDLARNEALKSCQTSASQFFRSKIKIKSLSVETEKSVALHQEVSSEDEIEGLICDPLRDQLEELDSQYSVWLECKFDLSHIKVTPVEMPSSQKSEENLNLAVNTPALIANKKIEKTLLISVVPSCESIIIKGQKSRTVDCKTNPIELDIFGSDTEALIRAKDYKPKSIRLENRRDYETIQVLLDK